MLRHAHKPELALRSPITGARWPPPRNNGRIAMDALDRRRFIASAAGAGATLVASAAFAEEEGGAMTRRFAEQRWALDNIIRANGIDWDQPRSIYLSAPCGVEANADFAAIRARVQKMAEGNLVTARDNWYMAAIHYGAAEWPYDDSGKQHIALHNKK